MNVAADKVKDKKEMVEKMGVFFEQRGLAPMHGRVFAYLLLAEPPFKNFYEIQEFLQASKSAISNALKFLMDRELVEYLTFSGDRRRYFQVNISGWLNYTKKEINSATTLNQMVKEVLEARSGSRHLDFNDGLEKMIRFQTKLTNVLAEFIAEWDKAEG